MTGAIGDPALAKKVTDLEAVVKSLSLSPANSHSPSTGVVGGLESASSAQAAQDWLDSILRKSSVTDFTEIYDKRAKDSKDPFNGMLFVKFPTPAARERGMRIFNNLGCGIGDRRCFMNPDSPIQVRMQNNFLRSFKKLLVGSWGFKPGSVRFDTDEKSLSVSGSTVVTVSVDEYKLNVVWMDPSWKEWPELQKDPEYLTLIEGLQSKLSQAAARLDKGKGKGTVA